jgi:hypothetical protein
VIAYERAVESMRVQRGDARALARAAAAANPDSMAARLLEATILVSSRDVRDFEAAGWSFATLSRLPGDKGQRGHLGALAAALDFDLGAACRIYDQILAEDPHDWLALWAAQLMDYFSGNAEALRERSARVLAHRPDDHAVLSLHAFALQECGDYAAAEASALRALELEPRDLRAEHALLHVWEMRGEAAQALRWAAPRAHDWHGSHHLWWHLALFMVAHERPYDALAVYDQKFRDDALAVLIDASALLWRLHLQGVDVGARFAPLAARWAAHADDAHCAFNDLHAMMAFAGARRFDLARRLLAAQERRLTRPFGANFQMTRLVGHPACRALAAYGRGDYRDAEALLRSLPPVAHRIGGSHAQRDILQLTRAAAAARRSTTTRGENHVFALSQRLAAA